MDFGRDQVTQITQGTFNRRHPVSVPGRRVKTLLGRGRLRVQRAQRWREDTDHTLQVISRWLNMSRKALIPHSRGSHSWGCCQRLCPQGLPAWWTWAKGYKFPSQHPLQKAEIRMTSFPLSHSSILHGVDSAQGPTSSTRTGRCPGENTRFKYREAVPSLPSLPPATADPNLPRQTPSCCVY